jgi:hypothetical protein
MLAEGKDFRAGLAVSLLFYKPPLGIVIGPLLLWKGRWRAVAGTAVGGALLFGLSWLLSPDALRTYPDIGRELFKLASESADFFTRHFTWMALVCVGAGKTPVELAWYEWLLIAAPIAGFYGFLAWAWRGPWAPGEPRFSAGLAAVMIGTFVITPYSYGYDNAMLFAATALSLKTIALRPWWHGWLILALQAVGWTFVSQDYELLQQIDAVSWFRVQMAPVCWAGWMLLECLAAGDRRPEIPVEDGKAEGPIEAPRTEFGG